MRNCLCVGLLILFIRLFQCSLLISPSYSLHVIKLPILTSPYICLYLRHWHFDLHRCIPDHTAYWLVCASTNQYNTILLVLVSSLLVTSWLWFWILNFKNNNNTNDSSNATDLASKNHNKLNSRPITEFQYHYTGSHSMHSEFLFQMVSHYDYP